MGWSQSDHTINALPCNSNVFFFFFFFSLFILIVEIACIKIVFDRTDDAVHRTLGKRSIFLFFFPSLF